MPNKTSRLVLLITPEMKQSLQAFSDDMETTPSQVVRTLIRDRLKQHKKTEPPGTIKPTSSRRR